jgi:hypothetical protein
MKFLCLHYEQSEAISKDNHCHCEQSEAISNVKSQRHYERSEVISKVLPT